MAADLSFDTAMLQDVLSKVVAPAKPRALVDYVQGVFQVSIRRGCNTLGLQKSTYFYKARRPSQATLKKCVHKNWFLSLADAWANCESYRHEYNYERPRNSIGNKSPIEFMKSIGATCHPMI